MARLIFLFLLLPFIAFAQSTTITGKVSAAGNKTPIAGASVFLSNSSFGTSTATDGTFNLNRLKPGQYNLVVTMVGYEDHTETIVANGEAINLNIMLSQRVVQLKEVHVTNMSKADQRAALERFKNEFIGKDENARNCKIINPDALNFSFHQSKNQLEVTTDDFLIVENQALGYRVKFLINSYKSDYASGKVQYQGQRFFEELRGKEPVTKKWYKKRDEAYYGSAMHFYRTLFKKDSLMASGFKIYHLTRVENTARPSEFLIQRNMDRTRNLRADSFLYWKNMQLASRFTSQKLESVQLTVKDVLRRTNQPGLMAAVFTNYLYVVYTKKWEPNYYKDLYRAPGNLNYATTIISFIDGDENVIFDGNGTVIGSTPLYEGTWADARLSEMLPVDYTPHYPEPDLTK
jgi:hypothetical protein